MKILYICLGSPFGEEMLYKENYLIKANVEDKNRVLVIASVYSYTDGRVTNVGVCHKKMKNGAELVRIEYDKIINTFFTDKIRKSNKLLKMINEFKPDIIMYNCMQVHSVKYLGKIRKQMPEVKIYSYVTSTFDNGAKNFLSKYILHGIIYKSWIKKSWKYFDKVLYAVEATKIFFKEMYKVNTEKMEFVPLCCEVLSNEKVKDNKNYILKKYNIDEKCIIFGHTGKMNKDKLTIELLKCFTNTKNSNFRLLISGIFEDDIKGTAIDLIKKDNRIIYLGFLKNKDLIKMLCAVDMYLQPGTASHTAQTAIGCSCAVVLANIKNIYEPFVTNNGYLINNYKELNNVFYEISKRPDILNEMKVNSRKTADKLLNYKNVAKKMYD